ncbi:hypothetical protein, partial [Salmonella enterica]|uniref:hypothetical protein n=1 Tax=Salmonella enterica TaxID=28901 RepID=UPI0019D517CE
PSYCPISNVVIARAVRAGLTGVSPVGLWRFDVTERATTIVIGIGEPFHTGGPAQVGDCYAALVIRNSGTGFCGLTAQPLLHRPKCSNGIVVAERGANVLKI